MPGVFVPGARRASFAMVTGPVRVPLPPSVVLAAVVVGPTPELVPLIVNVRA